MSFLPPEAFSVESRWDLLVFFSPGNQDCQAMKRKGGVVSVLS